MGNKFGFLSSLRNFKKTYKKCTALKSKVFKDSYDKLLDEIKEDNKKFGVKSGKQEVEICELNRFFQATILRIEQWILSNENAGDKTKDKKIMQKYTENLNKKRKDTLKEFSNCCKSCMKSLTEIDEYIEKAKKDGNANVFSAANGDEGATATSFDADTGKVEVSTSTETGWWKYVPSFLQKSDPRTLKQPGKQYCNFCQVMDLSPKGCDLFRLYVCGRFNISFVKNINGMYFDFKNYNFNGKENYTDPDFKERKIYLVKRIEISLDCPVIRGGGVVIYIYISPNKSYYGNIIKNAIEGNWVKVDGGDLSLFK